MVTLQNIYIEHNPPEHYSYKHYQFTFLHMKIVSNTESDISSLLKVSLNDASHKTQIEVVFPRTPTITTINERYPSQI